MTPRKTPLTLQHFKHSTFCLLTAELKFCCFRCDTFLLLLVLTSFFIENSCWVTGNGGIERGNDNITLLDTKWGWWSWRSVLYYPSATRTTLDLRLDRKNALVSGKKSVCGTEAFIIYLNSLQFGLVIKRLELWRKLVRNDLTKKSVCVCVYWAHSRGAVR